MLSLKKKILLVGVVCLIPSIVMGRCKGVFNNNGARGKCNGKPFQLSTTSLQVENQLLTNEVFDTVLNNSDNIDELLQNVFIAKEGLRISKISLRGITHIKSEINTLQQQLRQINNNNRKRTRLERMLSSLQEQFAISRENSAIRLGRIYSQYALETAFLRNQIQQDYQHRRQLKRKLRYKEKKNENLKQILQESSSIVSYSIASKFEDYQTCIKHNDVLSQLLLKPIEKTQRNGSFFSSSSSSGSNYSRIFSTLSGMSISGQSLEACSDDFQSLSDRFTLYEVGLALFLNPNNQSIVYYLFKKYGNLNPQPREIHQFMKAFQSFPKTNLITLINKIQEYMSNH